MWFADDGLGVVSKIATNGSGYTSYTPPSLGAYPLDITVGSDNNLWIVESGTGKIAQVTTAGVFVEYTIPTAGSSPFAITNGPDGNIWFTEYNGNKIGRFIL